VKIKGGVEFMVALSATREVADFLNVDQFQPAKTQFACGFFACAIVKSMGPVGRPTTQSVTQVIDEAEQWYAQYNGDNSINNTDGMSDTQLYNLLKQIGLFYQITNKDANTVRAWVSLGYPVIIAGREASFYDMALGDTVPYYWVTADSLDNHIITITGVAPDGNFLVRDPANVTNLFDPTTLRPGPRKYDAGKMQFVSATVVVPPWLPRPPAGFNSLTDFLSNDPQEVAMPVVPTGWKDDGHILTAPNGQQVTLGFRDYVLRHSWDPNNYPLEPAVGANPLEESNPSLGGGTQQVFRWTMLEWTPSRNVFVSYIGQELMTVRAERDALKAQVASLQVQVGDLAEPH
jgi:hypothetical protein